MIPRKRPFPGDVEKGSICSGGPHLPLEDSRDSIDNWIRAVQVVSGGDAAVERHYDVHDNPAFEHDEIRLSLREDSQGIPFAQSDVESVVIKVAQDQQPLGELGRNSIDQVKFQ